MNVGASDELVASKQITQKLYRVEQRDKDRQLVDVLEACELAGKKGDAKQRYRAPRSSHCVSD